MEHWKWHQGLYNPEGIPVTLLLENLNLKNRLEKSKVLSISSNVSQFYWLYLDTFSMLCKITPAHDQGAPLTLFMGILLAGTFTGRGHVH